MHAIEELDDQLARAKRFATLRAQLALRGHTVHELASGGFLVVLAGYTRHFVDLEGLESFAKQVGAAR